MSHYSVTHPKGVLRLAAKCELDAPQKQPGGECWGDSALGQHGFCRRFVAGDFRSFLAEAVVGRFHHCPGVASIPRDQLLAALSRVDRCLARLAAAEYLFAWGHNLDSDTAHLADPAFGQSERLATNRSRSIGR